MQDWAGAVVTYCATVSYAAACEAFVTREKSRLSKRHLPWRAFVGRALRLRFVTELPSHLW
jgi:hypothetical protein